MLEKIPDILHFWFGDDEPPYREVSKNWWQKDEAFDNLIRVDFEDVIECASDSKLDFWLEQPTGCLAYIILLDQFPRNAYRNLPKSFAFDHLAKSACLHAIEQEFDKDLDLVQRQFLYMPLEHSEDLDDQNHCVALFKKLWNISQTEQPHCEPMMKSAYEFALAHYEIIYRFGRFPHRNDILGRSSTQEEISFLKEPNSGF